VAVPCTAPRSFYKPLCDGGAENDGHENGGQI